MLLNKWLDDEVTKHFLGQVSSERDICIQFVSENCPETIKDVVSREQTVGEIRGLAWLLCQIQLKHNEITKEVQEQKHENVPEQTVG